MSTCSKLWPEQRPRIAAAAQQRRPRCRVLMTGVPMVHGAERVLDIVEQSGGLVVAMENCTGLKPLLEDVDETAADPLRALAEKYFHLPCSVMTPNDRRLDRSRPTGGRLSAGVRHRTGLAGVPHLRRGIAPRQALCRGAIGTALSAHRDRLLAFRFAPDRDARGSPVGNGARPAVGPNMKPRPVVAAAGTPQPMKTIAYSSPFVPAEWIAAHGLRPHWLRLRRPRAGPAGGRPRRLSLCGGTDGRGARGARRRGIGADDRLRSDAVMRPRCWTVAAVARSFC